MSKNDHWHSITDSSSILGAGIVNGHLQVEYHARGKRSGLYQYTTNDVEPPNALCCRLVMADSKGQFVQAHIKPLPYVRIG